MKINKKLFLLIIIVLCLSLSGCSLLKLPFALSKMTFGFIGQIFKFINKLPKPPPWVFL